MKCNILILAALAAWTATAATPARTATETYVTNKIAAAVAALPAPDYSTGNAELVQTIRAIVPLKWALVNVTNATGGAVAAADVGAILLAELVAADFSADSVYEEGDVARYDGKAYRANTRKPAGLNWQSWMWDEVWNVQTAMEGALRTSYLKLGYAGTNTESEVRITAGRYGDEIYPLSYFYLKPEGFGNRVGTTGRGWDFADHGYMEFHDDGTYRRVWFGDIFTPERVRGLTDPYIRETNETQFATSPFYVHSYLTNNYYTAAKVDEVVSGEVATAASSLVPNSRTVNGKPLSADISLDAGDVGAMASTAKIDKLYSGVGSRYISGDGSVYSQNAEDRWSVVVVDETYDFVPRFNIAPNYWECSDMRGGVGYLAYDDGEWALNIGSGSSFRTEGTASDNYLDFQLGSFHFPCTRYSTGTTFAYETRLAYTNDLSGLATTGALAVVEAKIPNNITRSSVDATLVHCAEDGTSTNIVYIRQATHSLAGLMTAADKADFDSMKSSMVSRQVVTNIVRDLSLGGIWDSQLEVWWTPRMRNGSLTYEATTNVNLNAEN